MRRTRKKNIASCFTDVIAFLFGTSRKNDENKGWDTYSLLSRRISSLVLWECFSLDGQVSPWSMRKLPEDFSISEGQYGQDKQRRHLLSILFPSTRNTPEQFLQRIFHLKHSPQSALCQCVLRTWPQDKRDGGCISPGRTKSTINGIPDAFLAHTYCPPLPLGAKYSRGFLSAQLSLQ